MSQCFRCELQEKGLEPRTGLPSPRALSYKRRLWHYLFRRQAVRLQGCKGLIRLHVRQQFPVYKEREKSHQSMSASLFARRQGIVRDGYLGLKEHAAHGASLRETSEFLCPSNHRDLRRAPSPTRGALWPKNRRTHLIQALVQNRKLAESGRAIPQGSREIPRQKALSYN